MFAPYQADPPETARSPDIASPRASLERRPFSPATYKPSNQASPPPLQHPQPQRNWQPSGHIIPQASPGRLGDAAGGYFGAEREGLNEFDTSLGLRLDYEACAAYLALPPVGAIVLLVLERKSDYVRFHAWQSALLFTAIFILHLVFSWSAFFGWLFFLGDLALIAFLTMRAYRDADMLDRYEVPFFGPIANRFLNDE
ncbi:hypothetical protein N0V93_010080 [Gnomoniopsis smithogilvyi]|uniref:Uncharacterized protein n=1 Tax=Gnomoniopsis smithogilvyi TaxID=1191159 RepID=A0A9W8YKH6_9PEZI|nr:hypothetical protein N0V93_010080 [Gnomoniopsis smithogilvyi]